LAAYEWSCNIIVLAFVVQSVASLLSVGLQKITERLVKPVTSVTDVFTTISLNEPLLSRGQKQHLNPLVVEVHSATKMPSTPVPFAELKTRFILYVFVRCCILSKFLCI